MRMKFTLQLQWVNQPKILLVITFAWTVRLNYILQDLFRDTPLDHIWSAQMCIFGHIWALHMSTEGGGVCIKHFWLELLRQWLLDDWDEQNSTALWFLRCHLVFSSGADGNSIYLDIIVFTIHLFLNKKSTKRAYIFLTIYTWRRTSAKGMKRLKTSQ